MPSVSKNIPTILVIFGATGDLMAKKIAPALFHLFTRQDLPRYFTVIGVGRRTLSDQDFRQRIEAILAAHTDARAGGIPRPFLELFSYQVGDFQNENDYQKLSRVLREVDEKWRACANKLFYLAVPPQLYELLLKNLASSALTKSCGPDEGWTRVIVEKPFGKDLQTAEALDELFGELFKEIQVYRIDHYLAKEMLQNILAFRFSNNLFEANWGRKLIERINIRLLEKIGVEDRGNFYDGVGALRDVGQNHLLQMLALVTMERPLSFDAEVIRAKRAEMLETLKIPSEADVTSSTCRAQYEGYRAIRGVRPDSETETYFKVRAFLIHPRWQGVPIILESGKRLGNPIKEIEIIFRHPMPCLCPKEKNIHYKNTITIHLEPKEGITIQFWSKKPGLSMDIEGRTFDFLFRTSERKTQYTEEYEKLLLDCITGDQTLFTSSREVQAMWKFIDPILQGWEHNLVPLKSYAPDSDAIREESRFIDSLSPFVTRMKKEIGIIGLGKMGSNLARRLIEQGWQVHGFNRDATLTQKLESEGLGGVRSLRELAEKLTPARLFWLMVPAGRAVDEVIFGREGLASRLERGDIVIDGGNSFYKDSVGRARKLEKQGVHFLDVGVSGGPTGARSGASLMIGGKKEIFEALEELFSDLAVEQGYGYLGPSGAGHFVKMVHNGIEYGMMQAFAEGFTILRQAKYDLDLTDIARIYNHGSVVESRLVEWLHDAFTLHGENLADVSGSVAHTGEGAWTVKTAASLGVKAKVIEEALKFRIQSEKRPSYTGKILSALREQFGGHSASEKKTK